MTSELVLVINAIFYTVALCVFLMKYKLSVGAVIWFLYTVSAWATVLFIQQPMYAKGIHASEQTLFPCIYLFVINLIAIFPLAKMRNIPAIKFSGERLLLAIMVISCAFQLVFIIVDIPYVIEILSMPAEQLAAIRDAGYSGAAVSLVQSNVWINRFNLLFSGMRILATGLSVYMLLDCKKYRKLTVAFFIITLVNNIREIVISVGRGEIVLLFLLYACLFYSLRHKITQKTYIKILIAAIPIFIVGVAAFWAITISRFGDYAEYTLYKYLGEPMNNFNGLLFYEIQGTTNGRAYFSLFYRYFLGQEEFINTTEKWAMINQVTGINGSIFYTWVGGLIIEFGKVVPLLVAIVFNRMMNRLSSLKEYRIGDLLVVIFFVNFYLRGVFHFPIQNFDGMFMMLYTFLLYLMFRIQKNKERKWVFLLPQGQTPFKIVTKRK